MGSHIDTLNSFDIKSLPDLDVAVLGALELYEKEQISRLAPQEYKRPLVVGSGNAEATGRIIFGNTDAVFASESDVEEKLKNISAIDEVVLVSASGGKHAPIIAKLARKYDKHVTLITNTTNSPVEQELEQKELAVYVLPKNREPYTYNTSTYLGMIFAATQEDPRKICSFIEQHVEPIDWPDFAQYDKYYLIIPPQFSGVIRMLQVKFIELFGRNIARDVETSEYVRHATTVAPSDELFISFGEENNTWGDPAHRLHIPLPDGADYAAMIAIGYYTIAQIQKAYPLFFKDNIESYTKFISSIFNEDISPIVDAT